MYSMPNGHTYLNCLLHTQIIEMMIAACAAAANYALRKIYGILSYKNIKKLKLIFS